MTSQTPTHHFLFIQDYYKVVKYVQGGGVATVNRGRANVTQLT